MYNMTFYYIIIVAETCSQYVVALCPWLDGDVISDVVRIDKTLDNGCISACDVDITDAHIERFVSAQQNCIHNRKRRFVIIVTIITVISRGRWKRRTGKKWDRNLQDQYFEKRRTILQGWKMQDWILKDHLAGALSAVKYSVAQCNTA